MIPFILLILVSAGLSSFLTLGLIYYFFQTSWRPRLERELRAREEALDRKLAEFGDEVEERVRRGVLSGVASIPSTEVMREGTRSLAKTGMEIMEVGLDTLLGGPRSRDGS